MRTAPVSRRKILFVTDVDDALHASAAARLARRRRRNSIVGGLACLAFAVIAIVLDGFGHHWIGLLGLLLLWNWWGERKAQQGADD